MIIYEIKNRKNGKSYIGQHSSDELGKYWGSGKLIKRAINKHGLENFDRYILERCSTREELNERERYWIEEKDSINTGYNLSKGGTGGDTSRFIEYSEEWKEGQRHRTKKYWTSLSESELRERSNKVSGEENGMFGKVGYWKNKNIPKNVIKKGLKSRRIYVANGNPNWKGGISKNKCKCGKNIAAINRTCSDCRDRKSKNNPFYGKTHSEEIKKKLSENRKGKKPSNIRKVKIDGILYESLSEASKRLNLSASLIIHRIKSKNDKYGDYEYIN